METNQRLKYAAAGILYLITLLFTLYFGISKFELQGKVEDLQEEKDELLLDKIKLGIDLENITDAYWQLSNRLERMEGEGE